MIINGYVKWIIGAAVLVGVIGGASVLYNNLSEGRNDNLFVLDTEVAESTEQAQNTEDKNTEEIAGESTQSGTSATPDSTGNSESITNNFDPRYDFSFTDKDGKQLMLSDLVGKPIVLNFWATWCGYCKLEMPDFEKMYKQYGNDINFVMMNVTVGRETMEVAKKYIETEGYTFPVYFDTNGNGAIKYGASEGIPLSFFFDKTGKLVAHVSGALDAATLQKAIDMIK